MRRDPGPARGLVRYPSGPGRFHHARIGPTPELADIVQHFWIVRWDLRGHPAQRRATLPHPNVHLVLERDRTLVHGVHTGRFERELSGEGGVFGVKFRPGGFRAFLGTSVSRLRNRSIPATDVFGDHVATLASAVLATADDAKQTALAEGFLLARKPAAPDPDAMLAATLVDAIAEDRQLTRVEQITARWPLNARRLQRLFTDHVGVAAKWVINRYRLHEALERLGAGGAMDWAALALELGYFDQAHFIRDFKALVGCTPTKYVRGL